MFYTSPLPPGPLLQKAKINDADNVTLSIFILWAVMKYHLGVTMQKISINILAALRTSDLKKNTPSGRP